MNEAFEKWWEGNKCDISSVLLKAMVASKLSHEEAFVAATPKKVWLLTTGDGTDGSEWHVESIHLTEEAAKSAQAKYAEPIKRTDGSTYSMSSDIEEWPLE